MDVDPKATQAALMHHTEQFMLHHVLAHGMGHIKPKHHWMFDVAEMLDWDLFMVDGFTVERLHLRGKFLLEYVCQPSAVENSCLASLLTRQVGHLQGIERTSLAISGVLGSKSVAIHRNSEEHQVSFYGNRWNACLELTSVTNRSCA